MGAQKVIDGLFWFMAFLFSTTVHEAAHSFVAMRSGDLTAYQGGQVSISPIPHIRREPIGMVLVPLFTAFLNGWAFGWASAPYDPVWADRNPRKAALMSVAGPAGNFLIALAAWGLLRLGLSLDFFTIPHEISFSHLVDYTSGGPRGASAFLAQALSVLLMLNVLLGTFNLLPLPPLDGASAVTLLLPEGLAERYRSIVLNPQFSLLGLLVAWQLFPPIARPLFRLVVQSLYAGAL
ncbi:MAG TPA: site-2 protease family protein [Polyangiaceae bacterium]|nr:site-2 protease family protein [Polyangiaceae bacterium]